MKSRSLAALVFVLSLATSITAHAWVSEVLDQRTSGGSAQTPALIAIDSADALHIVSLSSDSSLAPSGSLQYSTNASGSWVTTRVVEKGLGVWAASIAVDSSDKVHLLYGVTGSPLPDYNLKLKYAAPTSGSWVTEEVVSGKGMFAFMALDSSGKAHIGYDDLATGQLKYATNASGSWVKTVLDSGLGYRLKHVPPGYLPDRGAELSVAVDNSDKVHISYCDVTNEDLKYATNASGSWVTTTVDSAGSVGRHTSISIDSSGKVHISYYDATNDALKHATNASGSWVKEPVDSGLGYSNPNLLYNCTSVAVGTSDKVHINYFDHVNEAHEYATNASGAWVTQTVESGLEEWFWGSFTTSIVLDSSDNAHITYLDPVAALGGDLKHATNASGIWEAEVVPSAALMGGISVAVDSLGKSHVGYTGENMKYATDASGSWVTEVVDPVEGRDISIAVDSSRKTHIVYWAGEFLKYATNASGSWETGYLCILPPWESPVNTSIALDTSGGVHISYINTGDCMAYCLCSYLWYVTNASGSWLQTPLLSLRECLGEAPYLEGSSIALDSLDKVHISYADSGWIMYATNRSGSWSNRAVANGYAHCCPVKSSIRSGS